MSPSPDDVTRLLEAARAGTTGAGVALAAVVYDELRALARAQRRRHGASDTLNTTALLHEAYLRLASSDDAAWDDRGHFFRTAARVMRHVMVDEARRRRAAKRGSGATAVPLDEAWMRPLPESVDPDALDEALVRLAALDARQAEIVDLRFFVGPDHRRDGRRDGPLARHRQARLDRRPRVALRRDEALTPQGGA